MSENFKLEEVFLQEANKLKENMDAAEYKEAFDELCQELEALKKLESFKKLEDIKKLEVINKLYVFKKIYALIEERPKYKFIGIEERTKDEYIEYRPEYER